MKMAVIDPKMRGKFNTLSQELQQEILKRDVTIRTLQDLIRCLETIVREG